MNSAGSGQKRADIAILSALFVLAFCVTSLGEELPDPKDVDPTDMPELVIEMLDRGIRNLRRVRDYSTVFYRMERVGNDIGDEERILLKFRSRPFSVYMKWLDGDKRGREVIYVHGQNDNKMVVHTGPRELLILPLPTIRIDPNDPMVLKRSRHPITNAGFRNTLTSIKAVFEDALRRGHLGPESVIYRGRRPFREKDESWECDTYIFERLLPDGEGYYCRKMLLYLDTKTFFPVRMKTYGFDNKVLEQYTFKVIRPNQGFTDLDFDEDNEDYGFKF